MHSLRVKITAVTIAAILACMLAFVFASSSTVGQEADVSSAEKMHLLAETAQKSLDAHFDSVVQSVRMTSHIATGTLDGVLLVENGVDMSPDERTKDQTGRLDAHLAEHCSVVQEVFGNVADHTNGIVAYYYCICPDISRTEHGFFFSKMGKVGFEEQEPIDARELDPADTEHTTWYYTPIERGEPVWVGPYKDRFLGDVLTVSYLTPVYKAGTLVGVLGMDILFDTMVDQIDSLEVYRSGYACLLDDEGRVLFHPMLKMGEVPAFTAQVIEEGSFHQASSGNEIIRYEESGELMQLSFSTLANGMKLVVVAPVGEVVESWRNLILSIPLIAVVVLALLIPATMLWMGVITRPLQELTEATHKLVEGDYDIELNYRGKDEVGELTNAFRRLSDHLRVYTSNLNSKSFADPLTGVKNQSAYEIFAARLDDTIGSSAGHAYEAKFALVMFDCNRLRHINESFGHDLGDAYLQSACQLICQTYSHSPVFRVSGDQFVALLQERDYSNRYELLRDFQIRMDFHNKRAKEPWHEIHISKGMSTFRPGEDSNVAAVWLRAKERMIEEQEAERAQG